MNNQKTEVELQYFKQSGKYYSSGKYFSEFLLPFKIFEEVKIMKKNAKLPDLVEGSSEFIILVNIKDGYPALIF